MIIDYELGSYLTIIPIYDLCEATTRENHTEPENRYI